MILFSVWKKRMGTGNDGVCSASLNLKNNFDCLTKENGHNLKEQTAVDYISQNANGKQANKNIEGDSRFGYLSGSSGYSNVICRLSLTLPITCMNATEIFIPMGYKV